MRKRRNGRTAEGEAALSETRGAGERKTSCFCCLWLSRTGEGLF